MRPAFPTAHEPCAATAGLTWAVVDGELRHVSTYAALPPRERPPARCPAYPGDWTRELADLPWLPIFRLPTGQVLVSLWGRSIRLPDLSAAIARGDRRFRPAALARWNAAARLPH